MSYKKLGLIQQIIEFTASSLQAFMDNQPNDESESHIQGSLRLSQMVSEIGAPAHNTYTPASLHR